MYQRFILSPTQIPGSPAKGVISAAYHLLANADIDDDDREKLSSHLSWMRVHVEVPQVTMGEVESEGSRISRTRWIKPRSEALVDTFRSLQTILSKYGIETLVLKSNKPGQVVSEDKLQVIVEPFSQ